MWVSRSSDALVREIEGDHAGVATMTGSETTQTSLLRVVRQDFLHERTDQAVIAGTLVPLTGLARFWMMLSGSWSDRDGIIASRRLIRGIDLAEVADLRGRWDRRRFASSHFQNSDLTGLNLIRCW